MPVTRRSLLGGIVAVRGVSANSAPSRLYDPRKFGAVGNGLSNPASTLYPTLAACQSAFGNNVGGIPVALTQELDWLGTQLAICAARDAGGGVVGSDGKFVYCNANSVSDGSGTLTFPESSVYDSARGVSWLGGFPGSEHRWPFDLGKHRFAVICEKGQSGDSAGFFDGLILIGPGCGTMRGISTCHMQGISTVNWRTIRGSHIRGFKSGINVTGGQFYHVDLYLLSNFYAYYFDEPNEGNSGNMLFTRVCCAGSLMASVGVHHAASIINSVFASCFLGTSPFSIYKETNGGNPSDRASLLGAVFDSCQFEHVGNAVLSDDMQPPDDRIVEVRDTKFKNCQYMWDDYVADGSDYHLPKTQPSAIFDVALLSNVDLDGIWLPEQLNPGVKGTFSSLAVEGVRIRGDIVVLMNNCIRSSKSHHLFNYRRCVSGISIESVGSTSWSGDVATQLQPLNVGSVVVQAPGSYVDGCAPCTGDRAEVPLGVILYSADTTSSNQLCVYAYKGTGMLVSCVGNVSAGQILRTSSGGRVTSDSNGSPLVGVALSAAVNGSCVIKLMRLN